MSKAYPFEKTMAELEQIVATLEKGDVSLDACLKHYEKGIALARKCQEALTDAENRMAKLRASTSPDSDILE